MAGRCTGTLDGRPVVISADDSGVTLDVSTLGSALTLRQCAGAVLPFLQSMNALQIPLKVRVFGTVSVAVLPKAGWLVRLFMPELAKG